MSRLPLVFTAIAVAAAAALAFVCGIPASGAAAKVASQPELRWSAPLVAEIIAEWQIPGLAMAVLRSAEPPQLRCRGVCDIESGTSVDADTVFPICSVTNPSRRPHSPSWSIRAGSIGMRQYARYCRSSVCTTRSPPTGAGAGRR
jgi:hypothetical protein